MPEQSGAYGAGDVVGNVLRRLPQLVPAGADYLLRQLMQVGAGMNKGLFGVETPVDLSQPLFNYDLGGGGQLTPQESNVANMFSANRMLAAPPTARAPVQELKPQPVVSPDAVISPQGKTQKLPDQPLSQEELMKKWFRSNAAIEAQSVGEGDKRAMRARIAERLVNDGFDQANIPTLMLWVNKGSGMGEEALRADTTLQAAGMKGGGTLSASDRAGLEDQKAKNAFVRQMMLELIGKKAEDLKAFAPNAVSQGFEPSLINLYLGSGTKVNTPEVLKLVESMANVGVQPAGGGTVRMLTPDGKVKEVPAADVAKWEKVGLKRL